MRYIIGCFIVMVAVNAQALDADCPGLYQPVDQAIVSAADQYSQQIIDKTLEFCQVGQIEQAERFYHSGLKRLVPFITARMELQPECDTLLASIPLIPLVTIPNLAGSINLSTDSPPCESLTDQALAKEDELKKRRALYDQISQTIKQMERNGIVVPQHAHDQLVAIKRELGAQPSTN